MRVLIIGAGNSGLAMAVHLKKMDHYVKIWNRSYDTIKKIYESNEINSVGVINGCFKIDEVTCDLSEAVKEIDIIMVTTPASSHLEIAFNLSKVLLNETLVILNPGRTFGAMEFYDVFTKNSNIKIKVAESQTILYTCRKLDMDLVNIISLKADVLIAGYKCDTQNDIIDWLPNGLKKYFIPAKNIIETSLGNVGMILHCAPLLLNSGWVENQKSIFKYYYDGITPQISRFIENLDKERIDVSIALGQEVESTAVWMKRTYNLKCDTLYDCIQANEAYRTIDAPKTLQHRYIFEDIPCGLVPLESVGKYLGLNMNLTTMVIDLASHLLNYDFRKNGRNLDSLDLSEIIKDLI